MEFLSDPQAWARWGSIVLLDLVLAGDNALVIALAVRTLPARQQLQLMTHQFESYDVPLTADTRHMIGDDVMAAMKPSSFLINIARGDVIDEAALIRRLQAGLIGGAGLDVFADEPPKPDNPLWTMPNVIMTPRIGGMSDRYFDQALPLMTHNLGAFTKGRLKDMQNVV